MASVGGALCVAGIFDLIGLIPFLGALTSYCFMAGMVMWWYICDYKINLEGGSLAVIAFLKFFSIPGPLMRFVYRAYIINREETSAIMNTAAAGAVRKFSAQRSGKKRDTAQDIGDTRTHGAPTVQSGAPQPEAGNGVRGGNATRPTTVADKNIGLQNTERDNALKPWQGDQRNVGVSEDKSVDGIRPPEKPYVPTQPVFRQPSAANDNAHAGDAYREAA